MAARAPERTEGATPNGGAYAIAYYHDDGHMVSVAVIEGTTISP